MSAATENGSRPWWATGVIYQIFVPTFQDSDGDGVGDLGGVINRLDYLRDLGVDGLWLSPIYRTPLLDAGYDVSDYRSVDPRFGTLRTLDDLLAAAHDRGLRVLLDFVPNHTSDQHPWFQGAVHDPDSPYRDWYLWAEPGPDDGPPNNWASAFGGSAWTRPPADGQYYYHAHLAAQPNLNWREPAVQRAVFDALRFWLDRGVDGFRLDAVWRLIKDARLRDNPAPTDDAAFETAQPQLHTAGQPELAGLLRAFRAVADEYDGRVLMGELHLPLEQVASYGANGLDLPMNFALIDTPWDGRALAALIRRYEAAVGPAGWPNWVLSNHDRARLAARIGPANVGAALTLLLTLRGTPTLYYGDELGLPDSPVPAAQSRDGAAHYARGRRAGRDGQRMPMPWTTGPNAGFTDPDTIPWLPIPDWAASVSVAAQDADPRSVLSITRELLALRRRHPALHRGSLEVLTGEENALSYRRRAGDDDLLIALNLGPDPITVPAPGHGHGPAKPLWRSDRAVEPSDPASGAPTVPAHGALIATGHG